MPVESFDTVVVGAGSTGGVAAARLSEDENRRILLLEAGPDFPDEEREPPLFTVGGSHNWLPLGIPELDWGLWDAQRPNGHRVRLPRGKLVGGSSMANGTIAVRGAPEDFDRWAALGLASWDWEAVLPYYIRIETDLDFGNELYHGSEGPILIRRYREASWSPVHHAFVEACLDLGFDWCADANAPDSTAGVVGPWPHNRLNQTRLGTLVTYIRAARRRPNFSLRADALVDRVLIQDKTAVGVRYVDRRTGGVADVYAGSVVLSAGAYGSPAVLLRSGVGPERKLRKLGIDAISNLPVGDNLLDHPKCILEAHAPQLAFADGPVLPVNCRAQRQREGGTPWQVFAVPIDEHAGIAGLVLVLNQQDARGSVQLRSLDPEEAPLIDHRYVCADSDLRRFEGGWEFCREVLAQPTFRAARARERTSGMDVRSIIEQHVATAFHPAGTCRMGPSNDAAAVVDERLRVRGVDNLFVADASVFPEHIVHNPNLTCYVIGERAAEFVRNDDLAHRDISMEVG